jgi:hypothetical protein
MKAGFLIFLICCCTFFLFQFESGFAQEFEHPYSNRVRNTPIKTIGPVKGPSKKGSDKRVKKLGSQFGRYSGDGQPKELPGYNPVISMPSIQGIDPKTKFAPTQQLISQKNMGIDPQDKDAMFGRYGSYSGDIDLKTFKKQKDFKSRDLNAYSGDLRMADIRKQERALKAKAKKMDGIGNQEITIISKGKNMHPSIAAKGSKTRSQTQTQRFRAWHRFKNKWLKWRDLPPAENKKEKKPGYDSRESEIWN